MRSGYTQTFAGGYRLQNLPNCFPKTLRVDRPFGVLASRVAPILAEGANSLPERTCWSRRAASTLRITEVSEGGSPFLRAENVGRKPVLILDGEELVGRKNRSSTPASSSSRARRSTSRCPAWRRELQPAGLAGEAVFRQVVGGAEGERRGKPGCGRKLPQRPGRGGVK